MVLGCAMAVTAEMLTYQWAEMARIALGRSIVWPSSVQAAVKRLCSRVFIGLPWPRKAAGRVGIGPLFGGGTPSMLATRSQPISPDLRMITIPTQA